MQKILGRHKEIITLTEVLQADEAQFIAIYGRRRVGKTYLVKNYFSEKENIIFFHVTGMKDASLSTQINNFIIRIGEVFYKGIKLAKEKTWIDAYKVLTDTFKQVASNEKIVIFLDELPWMATRKSGVLESLEYFWNQYWCYDKRIKLIICGSSASWIIDKIVNNRAGLHNRLTSYISLGAFNLRETKEFLKYHGFKLNNKQVVELYMVTGGVPYYLSKLNKNISVAQNINFLAFAKNAFFLNEFDNLFASLFNHGELYIEIIKCIATQRSGLSQADIFMRVKDISNGGQGVRKLKDLEETGFIKSFIPYLHEKKGIYYKIIDEFSLFYLKWIEPIKKTLFSTGVDNNYWEHKMQTQDWAIWSGYAFESICYKHLLQISKELKINPISIPYSWNYVPKKLDQEKGAQIDLLFDRPDDAITICEIKYTNKPFVINKEYCDVLKRKMKIFKDKTKTRKQLFLALISANGVANNYYVEEYVSSIISLDDLLL